MDRVIPLGSLPSQNVLCFKKEELQFAFHFSSLSICCRVGNLELSNKIFTVYQGRWSISGEAVGLLSGKTSALSYCQGLVNLGNGVLKLTFYFCESRS